MSPFEFKSYREFLRGICRDRASGRGFQANLAQAAGCQPSYFSQALRDKVHLTEDQVLGISEQLELSQQETEYFILLLRLEKASTLKLRKYLESKVIRFQRENNQKGQSVPADKTLLKEEEIGKYFSSWIPSAVHLLVSNHRFNSPKLISQRLNVPLKVVEETLIQLQKLDFIEKKDDKWSYKGGSIHVPKSSPWQSLMQESRRQLALRSIVINPDEAIHFSSIFTIEQKDVDEIKRLIKPFLDKSHRIIQKSGTDELYCLCLDLFSVM